MANPPNNQQSNPLQALLNQAQQPPPNAPPPNPPDLLWVVIGAILTLSALFVAFGVPSLGAVGKVNFPMWVYGTLIIPAIAIQTVALCAFRRA